MLSVLIIFISYGSIVSSKPALAAAGFHALTIKYDAAGNVPAGWPRIFGVESPLYDGSIAYGAAVAPSGNIFVTGWLSDSSGEGDIFTVGYDSAGNILPGWPRIYNGGGEDLAQDIDIDPAGNVIVGGSTAVGTEEYDYITIKYDPSGNVLSGWPQVYNDSSYREGGGFDAVATSTISGGAVSNISVADMGGNYLQTPLISIVGGGGAGATAIATLNAFAQVGSITITNGGSGYTSAPAVNIIRLTAATGFNASATVSGGAVTGITVNSGGIGYTANSLVHIVGGGGTGATATATVVGGVITGVNVTGGGAGYTSNPFVIVTVPDGGYYCSTVRTVATDASGNVYVAGSDPSNNASPYNHIIKYNGDGVIQSGWPKVITGPSNWPIGLTVDSSGNLYLAYTGHGCGLPWFPCGYDYALMKFDSSGNPVAGWPKTWDGGGLTEYAHDVSTDSLGNVFVTGITYTAAFLYDYTTIGYDGAGNILPGWPTTYGRIAMGDESANRLVADNAGNVYVTGYSDGAVGNKDYMTLKYSSAGIMAAGWPKIYDASNYDYAESIDFDPSGAGSVYVTGASDQDNLVAPFTFDYFLSNSGNISVEQGSSGANGININQISGVTANVNLNSVVPISTPANAGITFSWPSGSNCSPSCSKNLTVNVGSGVPAGNYTITVTGRYAGLPDKTTKFNLAVTSVSQCCPATGDCTISQNPCYLGGSHTGVAIDVNVST